MGDPDAQSDADPRWDIATALLEAGAHAVSKPSDDHSLPLLHQFCKMGKLSAVKWILKHRAHFDIDARRPGARRLDGPYGMYGVSKH